MKQRYYILDGRKPVPADLQTWSEWMCETERHVAQDEIEGARISTVFLGLDHNPYFSGPPLLYETMVFGGVCNDAIERCSTWEQAEAMHGRTCDLVRAAENDNKNPLKK